MWSASWDYDNTQLMNRLLSILSCVTSTGAILIANKDSTRTGIKIYIGYRQRDSKQFAFADWFIILFEIIQVRAIICINFPFIVNSESAIGCAVELTRLLYEFSDCVRRWSRASACCVGSREVLPGSGCRGAGVSGAELSNRASPRRRWAAIGITRHHRRAHTPIMWEEVTIARAIPPNNANGPT